MSKPEILKPELKEQLYVTEVQKDILKKEHTYSSVGIQCSTKIMTVVNVPTQTMSFDLQTFDKMAQTDEDITLNNLKIYINDLNKDNEIKCKQLNEAIYMNNKKAEEILILNSGKSIFEKEIQELQKDNDEKDKFIQRLRIAIDELKKQIDDITTAQLNEQTQWKDRMNEENKSLLDSLKQLEHEKNRIVAEYKQLLISERDEYSNSIQEMQLKIVELETKLNR